MSKLWIIDRSGSYETDLAVVRAESLEDAERVLREHRVLVNRHLACVEYPTDVELVSDGPSAVLWRHERSWDPVSS